MDEIERLAKRRHDALHKVEQRTEALKDALLPKIRAKELSEVAAADLVGVTRMTIRAWLGKTPGKPAAGDHAPTD